MKNLLYFLPFLILWSCKSQPKAAPLLKLSSAHKVVFLDSLAASVAISKDEKENFFELINTLDMSIQMKKNFASDVSRNTILAEYKNYLKKDVQAFSKEEIVFVNDVFKEAYSLCNKVSANIFPTEIKLIKANGNHYGPGAYYTRENCIIIPIDQLKEKNRDGFLETMLHEISHIYTRYNPEKRKALYGLIGFKNIGNISNLLLKDALKKRVLLNPDGINFAYSIDLTEPDGKSYSAIPIIISTEKEFNESKPSFFRHLTFNLYKIRIQHAVNVICDAEGNSTINMDQVPNFFEQITDNTGYIIHPDEIIADNFMYIMMQQRKEGGKRKFSDPGLELLKNIKLELTVNGKR